MADEPVADEAEAFRWLWPLFESHKPQYTAAEVVRLTDVADHTLQNWSNRGLLNFLSTKEGKGGVRLYDKSTVLIIRFARSLIDLGMETTIALYLGLRIQAQLISRSAEIIEGHRRRRSEVINFTYQSQAILAKNGSDRRDYSVDLIGPGVSKADVKVSDNQSWIIVNTGKLIEQIQLKIMPLEQWADWTRNAPAPLISSVRRNADE